MKSQTRAALVWGKLLVLNVYCLEVVVMKKLVTVFGLWLVAVFVAVNPVSAQDMSSPANSLVVDDTGDVGVGTASPEVPVHVVRNPASATNQTLYKLENNGGVRFDLFNNNRLDWFFQNDQDGTFKISRIGSGGAELIVRDRLDGSAGQATMFVDGSIDATNVNFSSSQEKKTGIERVEVNEILAGVSRLPVSRWRFKKGPDREHIGPMAEDFREVFGIGDGTHISVTDAQGIALAAIQGLNNKLEEKDAELDVIKQEQDAEIASLKGALAELKIMVTYLVARNQAAMLIQ
ncbi:MAG: tail fiber domain-containing protein [Gammaproteobacteria bacterium]|nr:tail fiber domain-containing protein [Gammaproteobacteria bacterium]